MILDGWKKDDNDSYHHDHLFLETAHMTLRLVFLLPNSPSSLMAT